MAAQTDVLADPTDGRYDDYIELHNAAAAPVDLSGLWLSDKPFSPQGWSFPAGAVLAPGEYLCVWTDGDGGRCPRPPPEPGDGQDCPDPTSAATGSYHTNFALEREGDQIYLFDRAEEGFGVIHGLEFESQTVNVALSLVPDGDKGGAFVSTPRGSPCAPNQAAAASFRRGDGDSNCAVDITDAIFILRYLFLSGAPPRCQDAADADDSGLLQITDPIYILNYLFLGGAAPPLPGPSTPGADPSDDALPACEEISCR